MATKRRGKKLPIEYWSHSSLMAFLRNPLTWYKRYVEKIYDLPRSPSAVVGIAGHLALENFYLGVAKDEAIAKGLAYLRAFPDAELNFGVAKSRKAKKAKRLSMEREYLQAVGFYLARPPRHRVVGAEIASIATIDGLPLPVKAISDLVVESKGNPGALDIVDHKFVDSFSKSAADKPLFLMQAIFNYYVVRERYGKPVCRFIVYECKKTKNANGRSQLRKYVIDYREIREAFTVFHRLITDATEELARERKFLPNPSDMFEGEHSFDLYRLGLID
jgi:hypothetical protein